MNPKIFPTILMILDLCASLVYVLDGDWRKTVYWAAAGALTFVVTY
jgi:hypothetical protein